MRQVLPSRRRQGTDQATDPVAGPRFARISPLGGWMWLLISGGFLLNLTRGLDPRTALSTVVGVCVTVTCWRYERTMVAQHRALVVLNESAAEWARTAGLLVKNSVDLEHAGWITPEGRALTIETHRSPPAGSQPFYLLPGPTSDKWQP